MVSPPLGGVREYASPRDCGLESWQRPRSGYAPRGGPHRAVGWGHIPPPLTWGRELLRMPPPVLGLTNAQSCARGRRIMGSLDGDSSTCRCSERAARVLPYCFCGREAVSPDRLQPPQTTEAELRADGSWACWAFIEGSNGRMRHGLAVRRRASRHMCSGHVTQAARRNPANARLGSRRPQCHCNVQGMQA